MKKENRFDRRHGFGLGLAGALLLTTLAAGGPAAADEGVKSGWDIVSGTAVPSDCGGVYALELSGDLEGCWAAFPEFYACEELNGFALYREQGREEFNGTRNGESGRFVTTYEFEGVYPQGFCSTFNFADELAGGCDHYFRGTDGVFTGVVGRVTFYDIIPGISTDGGMIMPGLAGPTDFLYIGEVNR